MRLGISTACLYPMEPEKALPVLAEMDFRLFEIFLNTFSELNSEYLAGLKKTVDEKGAAVKSIHPFTSGFESFLLFSDYERRFQDGLELYKQYFQAANILGAEILVLHGQRKDQNRITEQEYFEHYAKLYALGKTFGITVAQENINLFRSNEPDFIQRMRRYLKKDCAFVLDVKQAVRGGKDPFDVCDAMGKSLVHVHLNDNNNEHDCLLPGCGTMNFEPLIEKLRGFEFQGDLMIEVYRDSFRDLNEIKAAKQVAEKLLYQPFK